MFGNFNVATVASALYTNEGSRAEGQPLILPLLQQYGARPQPLSPAEVTKLNEFAKTLRKRLKPGAVTYVQIRTGTRHDRLC